MSEQTAHPSRDQLSAYNLGQLPPDEAVAIESHLSECEPCCDTIIRLSSDDTFVGLLKEARQVPTDQTVDHAAAAASTSCRDVPVQLAEHPRYEILGLIGKGGMGDVYKARHRKMERTVALKVINRALVRKSAAVERFHREVKAAAQLAHPNIVTAYDADQAGDFHFMVMEYVDGVDLSQTVKDRGPLPVADACNYIQQAAIGLQHAHERGMVHRDIKPHNLMVTKNGTVKILDFGLASLAPEAMLERDAVEARSDLTTAGAIMGTPDFISPEQAKDARQADIRSDIYSLGATLYYLLSGRVPFDDGSVMHKLTSHAEIQPDSLTALRDDVSKELAAVVSKMMAKDPNERYLTPSEVAEALESFLRTWRPGEADSREQGPSSGGNMSGSGGQTLVTGEMGPDWLLVMARLLFAIAFLPVALIGYQWWTWDASSSAGGNRIPAYMLATLYLSTLAGVAYGLQRYRASRRNDQRIDRWTAREVLVAAALLMGGFAYFVPKSSDDQQLRLDPSPFGAQFRAAEKITSREQSDEAFAELARNAASTGDVLTTRRALSRILSREKESPTQRDCAIALFRLGKHEEAEALAQSIYYQRDRDAALLAFVQGEDRETDAPTATAPTIRKQDGREQSEALATGGQSPRFSYDLSQVPADVREVHGYRPRQIRAEGRFSRILETLDQAAADAFLMDGNLEQVLILRWASEDRTYIQPLIVLTVIDGTAMDFASTNLGVKIDEANAESTPWTFYPIESGKFFPLPEEQCVRFVNDKTMILSSREFLDAHQTAVAKQSNAELLKIAASMPDAPLWVIGSTADKDFLDEIKFRFSESPLAATLLAQLPIWEDTSYLTLALVLGENPKLQFAAHALAAERQKEITQTVRSLTVTLANMLRTFRDGRGPADAKTINALIGALGESQVTEPSDMKTQLTIPLKAAEPHLLRLLDAQFGDYAAAKAAAYKAASAGNLRQIALAMQFFEQEHGYLPSVTTSLPGAKHPVSWRVAILKYLDKALYDQYDLSEPWDGAHNAKLLETLPSFYRHPSQDPEINATCYVTLVGERTATGNGLQPITPNVDFGDDPAQTILVTEAFTNIPWTKPEDYLVDDKAMLPSRRPHRDGWNVAFVDGSAHFIAATTSPATLKALVMRNDGAQTRNEDGAGQEHSELDDHGVGAASAEGSKIGFARFAGVVPGNGSKTGSSAGGSAAVVTSERRMPPR